MSEAVLGIDISKKELVVALLINNKNSKNKFTNNYQGFIKLSEWFVEKGLSELKICMEATGSYGEKVADFLYSKNHKVSVVNPACIKSYARSRLARHKTDEVDALLIAEYASKNKLRLYQPRKEEFKQLRSLYRCQQNLKTQHTQVSNYLENEDGLPKVIVTTYRKLIKEIEKQIGNIELSMNNILVANPEIKQAYDNLQTIPGIGRITAIAMLAEVPDFSSFNDARQLAAYAGLTPKQRTSGSSLRGKARLSKIGSANLRKALYFPAISAKTHNPLLKVFADKLKSKGKSTMVIIGAIMRKLLHIIFGVIKHQTPFNPAILA
jgi:transposase